MEEEGNVALPAWAWIFALLAVCGFIGAATWALVWVAVGALTILRTLALFTLELVWRVF